MFITDVCAALDKGKVRYAIVGGYAVALHGAVRPTAGVDIAVKWSEKNLKRVEKALISLGLQSRLPVNAKEILNFREQFVRKKGQHAWSFVDSDDEARQVDVCLTYELPENKSIDVVTRGGKIPILKRRPLIKLKRKAARVQDLQDADALERLG